MSEPRTYYGILASIQDRRSSALKQVHETRAFEGFRLVHGEDYDKLASELAEVKRINIEDCISRGLHESRMQQLENDLKMMKEIGVDMQRAVNERQYQEKLVLQAKHERALELIEKLEKQISNINDFTDQTALMYQLNQALEAIEKFKKGEQK